MQDTTPETCQALARADLPAATLDDPERALLRFVELVTRQAYRITDADVDALRALGWSDPQIAETVYVAALFAFFNRVADAFGLSEADFARNVPPPPPGPEGGSP